MNPIKKDTSLFKRKANKQEIIKSLETLGFFEISKVEKETKVDEAKIVKKTNEEKLKEEERLAEEKRKKEERLTKEKRKEEEINRKLSIFVESELDKSKKIIQYTKEFVKLYPDEFNIVEVAKLFLSVDQILKNNMGSLEAQNLEKLRKFTSKSKNFKKYEKQFLQNEKQKKIELVNSNLDKLKQNINTLRSYLASNVTSYYSSEIITLIEEAEKKIIDYKSLEDLKISSKNIDDLMTRVFQLEKNISNLNLKLEDLKNYLVKYMSSDISKKIIEQIETIEKSLNEVVPQNIKKINEETERFIEKEIIEYEKKIAEEKRKEYLKTPEGQKEEKDNKIKKETQNTTEQDTTSTSKPKTLDLSGLDLKYCGFPQRSKEIWYFNIKGDDEGKAKIVKFMMNGKVEESDLIIEYDKDYIVLDNISELNTRNIIVRYEIFNKPSELKELSAMSLAFFKEQDGNKVQINVQGEGNFISCAKSNEIAEIEQRIENEKKSKIAQQKQSDYNNSPEGLLHNSYLNYQIISILYKSRDGYAVVYFTNEQMNDAKKKIKEIETTLVKNHKLDKDTLWNKATNTYKESYSHFDIVSSTGGYNNDVAGAARLEFMKLNDNYKKVTGSGSVEKDF